LIQITDIANVFYLCDYARLHEYIEPAFSLYASNMFFGLIKSKPSSYYGQKKQGGWAKSKSAIPRHI